GSYFPADHSHEFAKQRQLEQQEAELAQPLERRAAVRDEFAASEARLKELGDASAKTSSRATLINAERVRLTGLMAQQGDEQETLNEKLRQIDTARDEVNR